MSHSLAPAGPPTEEDLALADGATPAGRRSGLLGFSLHALMVLAAVAGVAYSAAGLPHVTRIWLAVVPFYAVICIIDGLRFAHSRRDRTRLIVTQGLHWLAFLGAMYMLFRSNVTLVLDENARSLGMLVLLALGTFVAGVHAWSWRVCLVGIFLAATIPAVAWIDDAGLLLVVGILAVLALLIASWVAYRWEVRRLRREGVL